MTYRRTNWLRGVIFILLVRELIFIGWGFRFPIVLVPSDLVFVDVLRPQGWLRCQIHASPVEAVLMMIFEATGAVCAVESIGHSLKHFRWWFLRRQRLNFHWCFETTTADCVVESMRHPWKHICWWFLRPQGLIVLSNPCVTRRSNFVDDFLVHTGWLRCRIQTSPIKAVSLIIYEARWAICAVESTCHPWKQFRWWFLSP